MNCLKRVSSPVSTPTKVRARPPLHYRRPKRPWQDLEVQETISQIILNYIHSPGPTGQGSEVKISVENVFSIPWRKCFIIKNKLEKIARSQEDIHKRKTIKPAEPNQKKLKRDHTPEETKRQAQIRHHHQDPD